MQQLTAQLLETLSNRLVLSQQYAMRGSRVVMSGGEVCDTFTTLAEASYIERILMDTRRLRMAGKRRPAETFRLVFGTNHIEKTGSFEGRSIPLVVRGVEVFKIERGTDEQLLLSAEVRDERGELLVKLNRNNVAYFNKGEVKVSETQKETRGLRRLEARRANGDLVLEVDVKSVSEIEVNGVFVVKGVRVEATKNGLRIDGLTLVHSQMTDNGTAISIG